MPADNEGQTPNSTAPEGQVPEGQQPAEQNQQPAPQLVDVNQLDEQGHQLWFPREAMEQVRKEAANYRNLLKEAKEALEAARPPADANQGKDKTPLAQDKTQPDISARLAQLEARERELVIENAILAEAARRTEDRGAFVNPVEAVKLLDRTNVQLHDDGTVKGVEDALKALAQASPHLLQDSKRAAKLSPTNPGAGGQGTPEIVKQIQARMTGQTQAFGGGGVVLPEE